jgi:hypothetical protein
VLGTLPANLAVEEPNHSPGSAGPAASRHIRRPELDELRALHASARFHDAADAERYAALRARLLAAAAAAQNEAAGPRQCPRSSMRGRRALPVQIAWEANQQRGMTVDLGSGGFAALFATAPAVGAKVVARLQLSRRDEVVVTARVASRRDRRGTCRASFAFEGASAEEQAAIERHLVDGALLEVTLAAARSAR